MHTSVLIVGAGPTGLTLACDLARRGVDFRLVEQSDALFPGSRGKGLQPRSQEVLHDLGVLDAVLAAGSPYPPMLERQPDGTPGKEWRMAEPRPAEPGAPYGEAWMLPQWRTQEILHDRLLELGGRVEFGTAVTGLRQTADRVEVQLSGPDGPTTATADHLVAADGGRSTVRRAAGIPMAGETVDPVPALVADLRVTGLDRDHWHVWRGAPAGPALLCPLPGGHPDDFQLFALCPAGEPETSADAVRRLVTDRTHVPAQAVGEVGWASAFRPTAAMADRFRSGRVFLAGDAAHVHSPAGGQGLNTGVQDAYNLGWKLGQVLLHGADPALLDSYEQERLPVAADVLEISTSLHRAGMVGPSARRGPHTEQLGVGYRGGPLSRELRSGLDEDDLQAGDRAPDAPCTTGDGTVHRLFDVLRGPHPTLVTSGADLPDAPVPPAGVRSARIAPGPGAGAWGRGHWVVRPDGYVGLASTDPADALHYLAGLGYR